MRTISQSAFRTTLVILLTAAASGCATGPKIFSNQDPGANLANYRTYGFVQELSTDRAEYSSLLSQYLRTATSRELEARGYRQAAEPDLLVNFFINTKEKISSTTSPSPGFGGYYGYRGGYYGVWGGYDTTVTQYTEGTLTIDLVDRSRGQLVWEGTAVGRVRDEARRNPQPAIDSVVSQIFAEYPVVPVSTPAAAP